MVGRRPANPLSSCTIAGTGKPCGLKALRTGRTGAAENYGAFACRKGFFLKGEAGAHIGRCGVELPDEGSPHPLFVTKAAPRGDHSKWRVALQDCVPRCLIRNELEQLLLVFSRFR